MKDTALLTITTVNKTRVVSLGKVARYLLLLLLFTVLITIVVTSTVIYQFNDQIDNLETKKQELFNTVISLNANTDILHQKLALQSKTLGKLYDLEKLAGIDSANQQLDADNSASLETSLQQQEDLLERIRTAKVSLAERKIALHTIPNGMPIKRKTYVTSPFGPRVHPITKKNEKHKGIDLFTGVGDDVFVTADGIVESSGYSSTFGNYIRVSHSYGFTTNYAHLKKRLVKRGDSVTKGQVIGTTGNTGVSTGPHLHYEVGFLRTRVNPMPFMKWSLDNYDEVFVKVKNVRWTMVVNQIQMQLDRIQEKPQVLPASTRILGSN